MEEKNKEEFLLFLERKKEFKALKDDLYQECRTLADNIFDITYERKDEVNLPYLNHMLKHLNEISSQVQIQMSIYNAFLEMSENVNKMRESLKRL